MTDIEKAPERSRGNTILGVAGICLALTGFGAGAGFSARDAIKASHSKNAHETTAYAEKAQLEGVGGALVGFIGALTATAAFGRRLSRR